MRLARRLKNRRGGRLLNLKSPLTLYLVFHTGYYRVTSGISRGPKERPCPNFKVRLTAWEPALGPRRVQLEVLRDRRRPWWGYSNTHPGATDEVDSGCQGETWFRAWPVPSIAAGLFCPPILEASPLRSVELPQYGGLVCSKVCQSAHLKAWNSEKYFRASGLTFCFWKSDLHYRSPIYDTAFYSRFTFEVMR